MWEQGTGKPNPNGMIERRATVNVLNHSIISVPAAYWYVGIWQPTIANCLCDDIHVVVEEKLNPPLK